MRNYKKEDPDSDFDSLDDRFIAKTPDKPKFAIKTNLDSNSVYEENPYAPKSRTNDEEREKFESYFEEE